MLTGPESFYKPLYSRCTGICLHMQYINFPLVFSFEKSGVWCTAFESDYRAANGVASHPGGASGQAKALYTNQLINFMPPPEPAPLRSARSSKPSGKRTRPLPPRTESSPSGLPPRPTKEPLLGCLETPLNTKKWALVMWKERQMVAREQEKVKS